MSCFSFDFLFPLVAFFLTCVLWLEGGVAGSLEGVLGVLSCVSPVKGLQVVGPDNLRDAGWRCQLQAMFLGFHAKGLLRLQLR